MKTFQNITFLLILSSTMGCIGTTFNSTKVGPNRFTVASHGHDDGPENYSRLLEKSYETCSAAGFKDYTVVNISRETRRVVLFVQCEDEKKTYAPPAVAGNEPKKEESSFMADLQTFYENAKKRLKEHTEESTK